MGFFSRSQKYRTWNGRRNPRLKAGYLMKYQVIDGGLPGEILTAHTRDISAGGLLFWTRDRISLGALLNLQVLIPPTGKTVRALGRVLRTRREAKTGILYVCVEFLEIPQADGDHLHEFIEKRRFSREEKFLFDEHDVVTRRGRVMAGR